SVTREGIALGAGLALAAAARPQLGPAVAVLLAAAWWLCSRRAALTGAAIVAGAAIVLMMFNLRWSGHPLGALPLLTNANADIHDIHSTFGVTAEGALGLLVSPSRGILVFSPVVLVAGAA